MDPAAEIHPPGCMLKIIHSSTIFSLTKIDTKSALSQKSNMELQVILGKAHTLSWIGFEVIL